VSEGLARDGEGWFADQLAKPHRLALFVLAGAVLSLGALAGVASTFNYRHLWSALVHPHWFWLALALAGELLAYLGYTLAYHEVARVEPGAELDVPQAAALVTTGFAVFVQGGGFALDRAALERAGLSRSEARARVLGLGSLEYALLAPATAIAALLLLLRGDRIDSSLTLSWVIGVPLGTAAAFVALRYKARFRRKGWRMHVYDSLRAVELLLMPLRQPLPGALAFLGIACYWCGDIFCLWAALHAFFAHTPPVAQLLVGYSTGYALTRRTLPLGGAGVVEALLPFALGWVGIARLPALLGVAAYRVINLWLPLVPALVGLPSLRRMERKRRRRPWRQPV
jgi:uncharacterized membrane protein YbhN (UPF0104 family)